MRSHRRQRSTTSQHTNASGHGTTSQNSNGRFSAHSSSGSAPARLSTRSTLSGQFEAVASGKSFGNRRGRNLSTAKPSPPRVAVPSPGKWHMGTNGSFLQLGNDQLEYIDYTGLADLEVQLQAGIGQALFNKSPVQGVESSVMNTRRLSTSVGDGFERQHPLEHITGEDFHRSLGQLGEMHDKIVDKLKSECTLLRSRLVRKASNTGRRKSAEVHSSDHIPKLRTDSHETNFAAVVPGEAWVDDASSIKDLGNSEAEERKPKQVPVSPPSTEPALLKGASADLPGAMHVTQEIKESAEKAETSSHAKSSLKSLSSSGSASSKKPSTERSSLPQDAQATGTQETAPLSRPSTTVARYYTSSRDSTTDTSSDPAPPSRDTTGLSFQAPPSRDITANSTGLLGCGSEEDHESGIVLSHLWRQDISKQKTTQITRSQSVDSHTLAQWERDEEDEDFDKLGSKFIHKGCLSPFIGLPSSPTRVVWDMIGGVLVLYDVVTVPLTVFDPQDNEVTQGLDWISRLFWTFNIFVTLTTAILHQGMYATSPKKIFINYMKFWLWVDILVVLPEWIIILAKAFADTESNANSSVKLLRVLRSVRVLRLLRLAKLQWIMASIKDLIDSEVVDISFNIFKMMTSLIFVNHFLACLWFALSSVDDGPNWIAYYDLEMSTWGYQYLTSYHWSITQFTPASMHVQPQNVAERAFAITVVVFGVIAFSYVVGSITGSLSQLRRMNEDSTKQLWNLRRYLKKQSVSLPLRLRIEKYLEHARQVQKNAMNSENLPILHLLTEQLRDELQCAISLPHLTVHPLFKFLASTYSFALQRIASKALSRKLLNRKEAMFFPGELAQNISFVVQGTMSYWRKYDTEGVGYDPEEMIIDSTEDWITEPAMWTRDWLTLGELVSTSVSEILDCDSEKFASSIKRTPQVFDRMRAYAANFVDWLRLQDPLDQSDIGYGSVICGQIEDLLRGDDDDGSEGRRRPSISAARLLPAIARRFTAAAHHRQWLSS